MPKLLFNGDDLVTASHGREGLRVVVELCRTELEILLFHIEEFPSEEAWVAGRNGETWVKVSAVDNFGVE